MRQTLSSQGKPTEPEWILATEGDGHISGQLREAAFEFEIPSKLEALIDEAAEALDDAHEEWLEQQNPGAFVGWNPP